MKTTVSTAWWTLHRQTWQREGPRMCVLPMYKELENRSPDKFGRHGCLVVADPTFQFVFCIVDNTWTDRWSIARYCKQCRLTMPDFQLLVQDSADGLFYSGSAFYFPFCCWICCFWANCLLARKGWYSSTWNLVAERGGHQTCLKNDLTAQQPLYLLPSSWTCPSDAKTWIQNRTKRGNHYPCLFFAKGSQMIP